MKEKNKISQEDAKEVEEYVDILIRMFNSIQMGGVRSGAVKGTPNFILNDNKEKRDKILKDYLTPDGVKLVKSMKALEEDFANMPIFDKRNKS